MPGKIQPLADKADPANAAETLRRRAEAVAGERAEREPGGLVGLSLEEMKRALDTLRVHQIELERQNEELRRMHAEMDASRERYFDLYDFGLVTIFRSVF